ncbi:ketopantoate reductase family protein [Pontibacter ruber]|uniref:2-dehydropantoate 2-reductase n=1 Tax=Pontibacter ruber TaxID=1343895 RepID=A0ABW5D1W7_9BACT|nr:2-dehydropantoate 2-reductase [Pontibacter ruber]
MIKIAIAGIGGVGGYFGGLLARHFQNSTEVEVYFIARGAHEKVIRQHGMKVETTKGAFTAVPKLVTSDPNEIGVVDFLICCTKSYHLEESITQLKSCINKATVILPLLNGVDSTERIKAVYPENEVWEGCVYVVSRLAEPGLVKETGNIGLLYFGSTDGSAQKLALAERLFTRGGIQAVLSDNIEQTIWEKFLFISTIATLTSYLDACMGAILANKEYQDLLHLLLAEIKSVADARGINLPQNSIQATLDKMSSLPYDTTSSMHSDFQKGKATELESLTGYVVRLGEQLQVPTPTYKTLYAALQTRAGAGS